MSDIDTRTAVAITKTRAAADPYIADAQLVTVHVPVIYSPDAAYRAAYDAVTAAGYHALRVASPLRLFGTDHRTVTYLCVVHLPRPSVGHVGPPIIYTGNREADDAANNSPEARAYVDGIADRLAAFDIDDEDAPDDGMTLIAGVLYDSETGEEAEPVDEEPDHAEPVEVRRGPEDAAVDMLSGPGWIMPRADAVAAGLVTPPPCACGKAGPHEVHSIIFDGPRANVPAPDLTGYAPQGYYDPEEIAPGEIVDHDDPRPAVELPEGAVIDTDLDELADELIHAYAVAIERRDWWMVARKNADRLRAWLVARAQLTADELATAAARFGIVADGSWLPLSALGEEPRLVIAAAYGPADDRLRAHRVAQRLEAVERQRSTGDVWAGIDRARANGPGGAYGGLVAAGGTYAAARYYEDSDGFEERERLRVTATRDGFDSFPLLDTVDRP